ncbi:MULTISPECIES: ABC transporter ATP-binding protein [unclassified Archaeoglobus]|jgi:ABC-type multidrug transport system ATPase subunit|uniref:ABC transporter ATP-binding protein n=1 Tax=unclassified Archaeoglobus TaxID=2643606 RepID=UPI0025C5436D|nr:MULTISPECIES: ABC transporter ATP-binding protein [unclassified Archaeoglobus]
MIVKAKNLSKKFGSGYAINKVDFELEREKLAVLGYNGAGKSTLVKLIGGILRPTTGSLEVFGENPAFSPEIRKRIGIASHNPMLYKELTIRENLEFYSKLYGCSTDIRVLAEKLEFERYLDKRVSELSRGFLQRVAFAKALINTPDLLLLDEITSGLDISVRDTILDMLKKYKGCIIFTTHMLEEAEFCDCFLVLKFGKRVYFGRNFNEAVEILNEGS